MSKKALSQEDLTVLRIAEIGRIEMKDAILQSCLTKAQFWKSVETLVKQKYLQGDVLLGFYRTKKRLPVEQEGKHESN